MVVGKKYRVDYVVCEKRTKEKIKRRIIELPDLPKGTIVLDVIEEGKVYPLLKVLIPVEEEDEK